MHRPAGPSRDTNGAALRSRLSRPEEITAQADRVAALHRELGEARSEAGNLQSTVDREQAEANRAARNLQDAESGTPRIVAEQVGLDPSTHLKDRLG